MSVNNFSLYNHSFQKYYTTFEGTNQGEALYIINSEGIAYHQHKVLYLIKPQVMQPSADDIRLRRWYTRWCVMIYQACGMDKKRSNFCLPKVTSFFIQAAGLAYHHDAVVYIISPFGAVSHHASACILLRLDDMQFLRTWWYTWLRLDLFVEYYPQPCFRDRVQRDDLYIEVYMRNAKQVLFSARQSTGWCFMV